MRVAIYARVSTAEQKTIPAQLEELREYAARRDWTIVLEIGEQESGAKDRRPGRQQVIDLAEKGKLDAVLVWKLDRWGRSTLDLLTTLMRLNELSVAFVSYQESIDTTTPMGRMLVTFLAAFAQYERDCIIERTKLGIRKAREERGGEWGRPATAQAKAGQVIELAQSGLKASAIARQTGLGESSVRRILKAANYPSETAVSVD